MSVDTKIKIYEMRVEYININGPHSLIVSGISVKECFSIADDILCDYIVSISIKLKENGNT